MKIFLGATFLAAIFATCLFPCASFANIQDDLKYLGYSDDLVESADSEVQDTHKIMQESSAPIGSKGQYYVLDEADAVKEQLAELGRTRALTPGTHVRSKEVQEKLGKFWDGMQEQSITESAILSPEFKIALKEKIEKALIKLGYTVKQLDLIDMPVGNGQVRVVARVVKPLETKNGFREIQNNLVQIKQICMEAGTIDGILYLSELTTFIAENPRNNYYYEKTVLNH